MRRLGMVLAFSLGGACGGGGGPAIPDAGEVDGGSCPADVRPLGHVYNGTTQATYVPITPAQELAIGAWTGGPNGGSIFCSGTLIAPEWVLTADHCGVDTSAYFCFGADASNPVDCLRAAQATSHATLDLTIVRLEADATTTVPGVAPIYVAIDALPAYLDEQAETAGFGETETGGSGDRLFAVELIDDVGGEDPDFLTVNGMGQRGVCFGDSGGPVMIIDADGAPRVAGALSWGDESCVDRDRYARVDLALAWIETFTGPTPSPDGSCGALDVVGRCSGERAMWCAGERLTTETCATGEACGWDADAGGFRCIAGDDPCDGFDRTGGCDGEVARWCSDGDPQARDCACLGQICTFDGAVGGAYCADDPCMGLDYLGECAGNVARWCDGGEIHEVDCAADGQRCGYVDDEIGYYCR